MIARWENYFAISYAKQALMKFFITLLFSSHMMACCWGLLGMQYSEANCGGDGVDEKVIDANDPFLVVPGHEGVLASWIVQLYNGKASTDSPCDPVVVYIWSLHFSVMTITSIGYGDISPVQSSISWMRTDGSINWVLRMGMCNGLRSLCFLDVWDSVTECAKSKSASTWHQACSRISHNLSSSLPYNLQY